MESLKKELIQELPAFVEKTKQFYQKEISMKEYKGFSGGYGAYAQKGGQNFMLRLRMNQGRITKEKLTFLVDQCQKHGITRTHCTTCQTVQLHDVSLDALAPIMEEALEKDIITRGGGGDFPRNVMCSPLSGLDPEENFDVLPYAQAAGNYLLQIINKYTLPRKLKVAFSNSKNNETHATFRDLGFVANEDHTFDVYCCGGLGNNPRMGVKVASHINPNEILYYIHTMVLLFMEHGDYQNRAKSRTRYLQETLGIEQIQQEFKDKVELAKKYLDLDISVTPYTTQKSAPEAKEPGSNWIIQKQQGLYALKYHPLCGNVSSQKWAELLEVIQDMEDVELRLSPQEDIYIVNLTEEEANKVLPHIQDGAQSSFESSVSCIGASTCQVGLRDSNHVLATIIEACRPYHFKEGVLPRIFVSGCPSSCGTHQIGTLGLQGFTKLIDKKPYPAFKLFTNGNDRQDSATFGQDEGIIVESELPSFFIELGKMVSDSNSDFFTWKKENPDQWSELLKKYA